MNAEHLTPNQIRQIYDAEVARWLPNCHTNHELCQTLSKLDAEHARQIYACCRDSLGYLEHYIKSEGVVFRLLPAVLGAFSAKCAICGWDSVARAEIYNALKHAKRSSDMFPMTELEEWYREAEAAAVICPKNHSTLVIWKLLRMLKVKVATPKPATIDTDYYN
jgi:hypothetical protein